MAELVRLARNAGHYASAVCISEVANPTWVHAYIETAYPMPGDLALIYEYAAFPEHRQRAALRLRDVLLVR